MKQTLLLSLLLKNDLHFTVEETGHRAGNGQSWDLNPGQGLAHFCRGSESQYFGGWRADQSLSQLLNTAGVIQKQWQTTYKHMSWAVFQ